MTHTLEPIAVAPRTEAPDSTWVRCRGCATIVYEKRYRRGYAVCPECGYHGALTAWERVDQLLDPGTAAVLPGTVRVSDPLGFVDSVAYPQRLERARASTGLDEAVLCVRGRLAGHPVVAAVMDFRFLGGSLGIGGRRADHPGRRDRAAPSGCRCCWSPPPAAPGCRRARCR